MSIRIKIKAKSSSKSKSATVDDEYGISITPIEDDEFISRTFKRKKDEITYVIKDDEE